MPVYDPKHDPDAARWLALEESARLERVAKAHRHESLGDERRDRLHAMVHLVVENQLAHGNPPVTRRTLDRLLAESVPRHAAIHAIGSVMGEIMFGIASRAEAFDLGAYAAKLEALDAAEWREQAARQRRR